MKKKDKVEKVMGEYKRGSLESSSGHKVRSRDQAIAIAMSEARRQKDGYRHGGLITRDGCARKGRTRGKVT